MCQVPFMNGLYHSYVLLICWMVAGGIVKALLTFISPVLLSYILCCYRCYTHAIRHTSLLDKSQQVITVESTGRHMFDLFFPSLLTWVGGRGLCTLIHTHFMTLSIIPHRIFAPFCIFKGLG